MAAIYSNGGNRWNIVGFNFTKRDALSSLYKISMVRNVRLGIYAKIYVLRMFRALHELCLVLFRKVPGGAKKVALFDLF
jgi:hypothetical protein